jgi:hypothetical protein
MWSGRVLQLTFPHLFSFTRKEDITVASVLELNSLQEVFQLPLSKDGYAQFCELDILLQSIQLNLDKDTWTYI